MDMVNKLAVKIITFYQKYLSPRKGYICAHRYYLGTDSCSEYTKQAVLQFGIIRTIPLFFDRLKECKHVYEENKTKDENKKKDISDNLNDACNHQCCTAANSCLS
jgi:putative component of membrane protein insertase Oxa1/YidC/SpoIIIJ protein YidD